MWITARAKVRACVLAMCGPMRNHLQRHSRGLVKLCALPVPQLMRVCVFNVLDQLKLVLALFERMKEAHKF